MENKNLKLGQSEVGKAVFANENFKKGDIIVQWKGPIITKEERPEIHCPEDDRYTQIGPNKYMWASGEIDDFINHSCDPNSGLLFQDKGIFLIAIKNIYKEDEITWDYSTTMDENDWEMDCLCKSKRCRKRIKDFKHLPPIIQHEYIKLGIVPKYILENSR
jgi:hypothetical protein